ncbi:MAG: protein-L-isoaspartate(D-aspartate) O-methyltransferase [Proteobacteria bacterium]|jgi:protein-L-isoaspartate(D-aspartate) O-methyltransferase|nr:protein-L-isoaspartate(D-aspartate) O-methyltransferase [Desulfocapsa sp.]MBU3944984.1 protein-L-isoaspartate(D-aspartate) O-methyltransferase [Pseudomonadota bacterium]MCG2745531.1 protein-L-isoaspartate(D-aspartate) O-methyltransferase [Desulfobacteraceae bacterium]MBU3983049.1 protein-L-isoaspartate(D-aspartate) O-methyltransferase [Pseudomonadota bacterium]MBU4029080.1 protein-L-isoaspartate(D-aspartate) O-methyltransferase [Pseudomonadota bacterium]
MSNRQQIDAMLQTIDIECSYTKGFTGRSSLLPEVMEAMRLVLRHDFVPPSLAAMAYENTPLPIGKGQTISQPFIVALMTDLLCPEKGDVILEVGAGSGYQAAILSLLVRQVYTIEIIPDLADRAKELLQRLGYGNIEVRQGDGYNGWPKHAPFDGIIVTAAATHVPPSLKEQLKPGGKLIVPIGQPYMPQELLVLEKDQQGVFCTRNVLPVSFVPLTRA